MTKENADHVKRILRFQKRRLRYMSPEAFNATYSVAPDGSHRHSGMKGIARRLRKDAMKARTSHPGKLVKTGGLRSGS